MSENATDGVTERTESLVPGMMTDPERPANLPRPANPPRPADPPLADAPSGLTEAPFAGTVASPVGGPVGGPVASPVGEPTPQPAFDVVLRGYERHQVDRHVAGLVQRIEQLRADLTTVQGRELAALQESSRAKADLERGRPSFDALGDRVGQLLGLAEAEAMSLREEAERAANHDREQASQAAAAMRSDAEREAEQTLASARIELTELQRRRDELLVQIGGMRDTLESLLTGSPIDLRSAAPEPTVPEPAASPTSP